MDGLSTIGSIIAIAQAIGAIPSIIKTLDRFVHTKRELAGLLNELYTLQLLRLAVEDTGKLFSAADNPGELAIPEPPLLSRARTSLDKIITELRLLADRLERQSTLHRLKFILCSRKIAQLQADARAIRENLHLALSQMALLSQHAHGKMLLEVHSIISNKDVQSHQALPPQSSLIPSIVESETGHTAGMISDQPPALFQSDSVPNERSEAPAHHTEARPSRDFVRIETSLRLERKCNVSCHCQCHFNRMQLRSPRWLSCALGNFFLSYDCLPVPGRWKCDQAQCSRSSSSLHVSYHLPRWLIDRALSLTASFDGLTGGGATIHFTVPRILGMRNILWKYISMDDVVCVEKLLRETRHRPTDMNEYGHSLLQYAILQRASRVFELMNQTWQLHRFPNRRDRNSMLLIRELVMTSPKRQTDPFILAINRLIDCDEDELDAFGATPLILAVEKNNVTIVRLLLEAGARLETSDHGYGRRILHFVALYGDLKLINFFRTVTAAGQSMTHDTEDLDGNTPINSWKWRTQSNGRLWPGMRRPTLEETDAFEGLIQDIRNRAVPR
ncbi:Ankyrin repeat-containing protein [Cladophialophora immunda]|nr:Ankyrin repeat-containing protein [Cladophialophora immunda]